MKTLDPIKEARRAHLFALRATLDDALNDYDHADADWRAAFGRGAPEAIVNEAADTLAHAGNAVAVALRAFPGSLEQELQALEDEERS